MKILHLIPSLSGGGAERQLSYLAVEHAKEGHQIHIAYFLEGTNNYDLPGVFVHKLKSRSNYDPYIVVQLILLFHKIKPDLIHSWIVQMDIIGAFISRTCNVPWILREPSSSNNYLNTFKNKLRVFLAARFAKAIVANSIGGLKYWEESGIKSKVIIIKNGIPLKQISIATLGIEKFKKGIEGFPLILFVGRLSAHGSANKNLLSLLKATKKVKEIYKLNFNLAICGDGPQKNELENEVINLDIKSSVKFLGQISPIDVWRLMKKSTIFISLSAYEGCPNSVLEAMACETALILSNIDGHKEILDEKSAIIVDPLNSDQVAAAIINLLNDEKLRYMLSINAKEMVQDWSIEDMSLKYSNLYKSIIEF